MPLLINKQACFRVVAEKWPVYLMDKTLILSMKVRKAAQEWDLPRQLEHKPVHHCESLRLETKNRKTWVMHSLNPTAPNDTACLSNPRGNDTNVFTAVQSSHVSRGPQLNYESLNVALVSGDDEFLFRVELSSLIRFCFYSEWFSVLRNFFPGATWLDCCE